MLESVAARSLGVDSAFMLSPTPKTNNTNELKVNHWLPVSISLPEIYTAGISLLLNDEILGQSTLSAPGMIMVL